MSFPKRPLSRRAVMKAAGIAPMVILAKQAWADPSEEMMAKMVMMTPKVDKVQLKNILDKAETDHNSNRDRYELVARAMWTHFLFGAGEVEVKNGEKLLEHAYKYTSGGIVATNVKNNLFDPLGNDQQTNVCAYVCGHKAATKALAAVSDPKKAKITKKIYEEAWDETKGEMNQKLVAARAMSKKMGRTSKPGLGGGC